MERLALKPKEAADMLGISERTLWSLREAGKIKAKKIGRAVRYAKSELIRFLEESE